MTTLSDKVSERLNKEMELRSEDKAERIQELSSRFEELERQGLVRRDSYQAVLPTALAPRIYR